MSLGEPGKQVRYVDLPFHLACTLNDDVDDAGPRGRSLARPLFARRPFPQPTEILTSLLQEQDFGRHDSVESLWTLPHAHRPTARRG